MPENRIGALLNSEQHAEDDAIAKLTRLQDVYGAESRAAEVVAEKALIGHFRYNPGLGWLEWNGKHWDTDDVVEPRVIETVRQCVDALEREYRVNSTVTVTELDAVREAVLKRLTPEQRVGPRGGARTSDQLVEEHATDEERARCDRAREIEPGAAEQAEIWLNLLSSGKISSLVKLCRGMDGIVTRAVEFDTHHDLKNCHNGVVDLRTGDLLPHDRDLMFTRMSGAPYLPGHRNADWDKALTAVAPDALEWFQTRIGQSITGHIPDDDALVVAEGGGENGKTGIMAAIREACGTYGDLISHRVLLSQPGQHPTELMDLRGLRFALLEETPEEGHLDTHRIKMTVGTPKIEARRMRRDPVVFDATHTMWVTTNHRLQVDTTDWATWRRLKLMIFPFKFLRPGQVPTKPNERVGDRTLRPKLFHDPDVHAAALAWAVEGAIRWYQNDRVMPRDPESVREATEKWRRESDVAYRFAVEKLVKGPNSFIAADDMKEQFLEFLQAEEKRPWTSQTINQRLPASLAAADMPAETDPTSPTKVRDGDQESRPEGRTSRGAKLVRMWRGVRFKTDVEVKAAEAEAARRHLKLMGS